MSRFGFFPKILLSTAAAILIASGSAPARADVSSADNTAAVKRSFYTPKILALMRNWPPADLPSLPASAGAGSPFWIEAIRTPGDSSYIGLRKRIFIQAPVERVARLFEDFAGYPSIYPGVEQVRVLSRGSGQVTTSWIRDRVVFFMPKIQYEQVYFEQDSGARRMYRYQLKSGNSVNYADGVVVLEEARDALHAQGPAGTYVTSYDFFEGNFGFARFFAESKIWHDTLEGYAQADYALKLKAENDSWSKARIGDESEAMLRRFPVRMEQVRFAEGLDLGPAKASRATASLKSGS